LSVKGVREYPSDRGEPTHVGCPRTEIEKQFLNQCRWPYDWPIENNIEDHPVVLEVIKRAWLLRGNYKSIRDVDEELMKRARKIEDLERLIAKQQRNLDMKDRELSQCIKGAW